MRKLSSELQVPFLRDLVERYVRAVVEHEDQVRVVMDVMPKRVVFSIFVAQSDVGLALGNDGANVNAIRRIVWTACKKTDYMVDLDVVTTGVRASSG